MMRSSALFLSLILISSIQFLSAQSLVGEWSNPNTYQNTGDFCCIPTSITIKKTSTVSWAVTYEFNGSTNQKCRQLFSSSTSTNSGEARLYKKLDPTSYGVMIDKTEFFTIRLTGTSGSYLNVAYTTTTSPFSLGNYHTTTTKCDFTMYTYKPKSPFSVFIYIIAAIPILGFLYYRRRQNIQADELAKKISFNNAVENYNAEKQAQRSVPVSAGYVAPVNTAYTQQYAQVPVRTAQPYVQAAVPTVAYTQQYVQPYPQAYMQYVPVAQPTYVQQMAMAMPVAMMPQVNMKVQGYAQPVPKAQVQGEGYAQPKPQVNNVQGHVQPKPPINNNGQVQGSAQPMPKPQGNA